MNELLRRVSLLVGLEETPAEVIDKREAGLIDDAAMMDTSLNWQYEVGRVEYVDGVATDAYTARDWDDVEQAYSRYRLTDDEFTRLLARHQHPARESGRRVSE